MRNNDQIVITRLQRLHRALQDTPVPPLTKSVMSYTITLAMEKVNELIKLKARYARIKHDRSQNATTDTRR